MKKHKGHARHVFSYIEKTYKINNIVYAEEEEKKGSKKSSGNERKSLNTNSST